ncbi:transmembrane protein 253 [Gouania willdenowi]|uniref:Transmembrane protein 253-like n=1 Tax=Gouania willdenowi TaxID=441366 RepID=A0A8C5H2K7_GOUWI|nr:transmembrane protein 253-like [Gouania willdenowi]
MTQNMFMEGLYHVFLNETPPPPASGTSDEHLNTRIHRWFGTVVNTRLLLAGVVQVFCALACILFTIIHACVSYSCSLSMVTPVWPSLVYVAAGCLAVEAQRKATKIKILFLIGLNIFSLLFGFSALLATSLRSAQSIALNTYQQRAGSYVAKASSTAFTVQCFLASIYIILLSWKGLYRYSSPSSQVYSRISQEQYETNGPLLEQVEYNL